MSDLTFLRLDVRDGWFLVQAHEESRIDAALSEYLSSGQTRDKLLDVELLGGQTLNVRVSTIESFYLSTTECRRLMIEREKTLADETKEIKASLGFFEED